MNLTIHPRVVAVAEQLAAARGPDYAAAWLADTIAPALASILAEESQRRAIRRHEQRQQTPRSAPDLDQTIAAAMAEIEKGA